MATASRFLINDSLWQEIQNRVAKAKRVRAAVAYVGRSGAKLLKLKKGDQLVVDMSLAAVRQGVTDPKAIRTFISRGVQVFTRAKLHAKLLIMDNTLVVGSMNASDHSRETLDEAGVLTTDATAVKRARSYFEKLCTEPVRKAYLKECIKAYRPPEFKAAVEGTTKPKRKKQRIQPAKLWIIAGLSYLGELREGNRKSLERREKQVRKKADCDDELTWIRFPKPRAFFDAIQPGDWVIQIVNRDGTREVSPPTQLVVPIDKWESESGKLYDMLWLEEAPSPQTMSWSAFRKKAGKMVPSLDRSIPRTQGIEDDEQADGVLKLWTKTGRISSRQ